MLVRPTPRLWVGPGPKGKEGVCQRERELDVSSKGVFFRISDFKMSEDTTVGVFGIPLLMMTFYVWFYDCLFLLLLTLGLPLLSCKVFYFRRYECYFFFVDSSTRLRFDVPSREESSVVSPILDREGFPRQGSVGFRRRHRAGRSGLPGPHEVKEEWHLRCGRCATDVHLVGTRGNSRLFRQTCGDDQCHTLRPTKVEYQYRGHDTLILTTVCRPFIDRTLFWQQ